MNLTFIDSPPVLIAKALKQIRMSHHHYKMKMNMLVNY
jgi:hypothetical protein